MRDSNSRFRITRVVVDGDHDVELAQVQAVMLRIQLALRDLPAAERAYIGNALLNMAIGRILGEEGSERTATLLMRLSDAAQVNPMSVKSVQAIDLQVLHA
jgi:hypothetical protein